MRKSAPFNDIMAPGLKIGGFKSVEHWLELLPFWSDTNIIHGISVGMKNWHRGHWALPLLLFVLIVASFACSVFEFNIIP